MNQADGVVINAEGTIHDDSEYAYSLLEIVTFGKIAGVNALKTSKTVHPKTIMNQKSIKSKLLLHLFYPFEKEPLHEYFFTFVGFDRLKLGCQQQGYHKSRHRNPKSLQMGCVIHKIQRRQINHHKPQEVV